MGDHSYSTVGRIEQLEQMIDELKIKNAELLKFAKHNWSCELISSGKYDYENPICTCGLDEIVSK